MRAYHRVDPLMDERKSHYTPAQFGAYLKVQLVAGRQSTRGTFRSLDALRAALPNAYGKHVDFLLAECDLVVRDDGSVYLDGWQEWQEGDLTVGDRMRRLRDRKRHAVTPEVTPRPVTPPSPNRNGRRIEPRNAAVTQPSPAAIGVGIGVGIDVLERINETSSEEGARAERPVDPLDEEPVGDLPW